MEYSKPKRPRIKQSGKFHQLSNKLGYSSQNLGELKIKKLCVNKAKFQEIFSQETPMYAPALRNLLSFQYC